MYAIRSYYEKISSHFALVFLTIFSTIVKMTFFDITSATTAVKNTKHISTRITSYNVCYTKLLRVVLKLLDSIEQIYSGLEIAKERPIKGYIQVFQMVGVIIGGIRITSYNVCYTKLLRLRRSLEKRKL